MLRIAGILVALSLIAPCVRGQDVVDLDWPVPFEGEKGKLAGLVITLDPGHGGSAHQPGYSGSARGVNTQVIEGDVNLKVASLLRHFLKDAGAEVHMTRTDDRKVAPGNSGRAEELGARTAIAEATRSHLFLSLHHNSSPRRTADGVMMLIWPTDKAGQPQPLESALAGIMEEEVKKTIHWKEDFSFYVIDHPLVSSSDIPSAVVEFGFLSNPEFDAWVVRPDSAEKEAIGAYNGVVRMWEEQRGALDEERLRLFPDAAPVPPREESDPFAGIASRLWSQEAPPTTAGQLQSIIANFKKFQLSDSTLFLLDAKVSASDGGWKLSGVANHPRLIAALPEVFRALGVGPVENEIRLLPDAALGEDIYGIVQIPMALTWGDPREGGTVQSQLILGDEVWLLEENADKTYIRLHGPEGYIGWVRSETVRRMAWGELSEWMRRPRAVLREDLMALDFRLPAGAALPVEGWDGGTSVTLALPRAVRGAGNSASYSVAVEALRFHPASSPGRAAIDTAARMLGTPYVFGARTSQGIDCSGLVGVAWAAQGVQLPRDAFQQVLVGRLVGTFWQKGLLQPGDVVFFIDETTRVTHTGLSLGGGRFIHASPPEVQISSFDPEDPLYNANWTAAFCFARRPVY